MKKEEKTKLWNDAFECGRQETIGEYKRKVSILRADMKSKNALRIINGVFPVVGEKEGGSVENPSDSFYVGNQKFTKADVYDKNKKSVVGKKEK